MARLIELLKPVSIRPRLPGFGKKHVFYYSGGELSISKSPLSKILSLSGDNPPYSEPLWF